MTEGTGSAAAQSERYVRALAERSERGLREVLSANVRFRGLTPDRVWEADSRDGAIEILLGSWFEDTDHIEEVLSTEGHAVADRIAIRYRFKVRNDGGLFVVEQQGYLTIAEDGCIADASIVCSGFLAGDAGLSAQRSDQA